VIVIIIEKFDNVKSYHKEYSFSCGHNCLRQVLEYYEIKNALFFINSSLSLILTKRDDIRFGYSITDSDIAGVLPGYERKLIVRASDNLDPIRVWEENKIKINEGIPLLTLTDLFYFEYAPMYKKEHCSHSVILYGYSEDETRVNIIDYYGQWLFKGEIPIKDFFMGRSSDNPIGNLPFSGVPIKNTWCEIEKDGWYGEPGELLLKTISLTIEQYYDSDKNPDSNIYLGINALKALREIISCYKDCDDKLRIEFLNSLYKNMLPISSKFKLFKFYVESSLSFLKTGLLEETVELLKVIATMLEIFMGLIFKSSMEATNKSYFKIIDLLNEIIIHEEKLYDVLTNLKCIINT
jgi:hypothetical protein